MLIPLVWSGWTYSFMNPSTSDLSLDYLFSFPFTDMYLLGIVPKESYNSVVMPVDCNHTTLYQFFSSSQSEDSCLLSNFSFLSMVLALDHSLYFRRPIPIRGSICTAKRWFGHANNFQYWLLGEVQGAERLRLCNRVHDNYDQWCIIFSDWSAE